MSTRRARRASARAPYENSSLTPVSTSDEKTDAGSGALLIDEATELIGRRRWREALGVLDAAQRLRPEDPRVIELRVIAAAHRVGHRQLASSLAALQDLPEHTASTYTAQAMAALARHRFLEADSAARAAIASDPDAPEGWAALAAAFAGLGWFDQAEICRAHAESRGGYAELHRWQLGRAINRWAMSQSHALIITAISIVLVGQLALSIGISAPILLRELRVQRLSPPFRDAAQAQWRTEHGIKITFAIAVLISVITFIVMLRTNPI